MKTISYAALLIALMNAAPALASTDAGAPETIVVKGHRPERPPTTTESTAADAIGRTTNFVTPEDALRYMPNVLIRQRHIGDTQSPVSTRTSGAGASARSLIYADGILLSALIGNNNTSASPKWGLVAPDAIERVDVLYGPFSAAYPGNSLGSTIVITTRMPMAREGSIEVQGASQSFAQYGDKANYGTGRIAAGFGNRKGKFAVRLGFNHLDSHAQPLAYATATVPSTTSTAGIPVTGAFDDTNRAGVPIKVLGSTAIEHQVQDNLSGRAAYDLTPSVTMAYTFGLFRNRDDATVHSYLRDGVGNVVYSGTINIDNKTFALASSTFSNSVYRLHETLVARAFSLISHSDGAFDYDITATHFDYADSHQKTPTTALPSAFTSDAGVDAVLDGTGWTTLDAKGMWRPQGPDGEHILSVGVHADSFRLDNPTYLTAEWRGNDDGAVKMLNRGRTRTDAVWIQDAWRWKPDVTATLGLRFEDWRASGGRNYATSPALDVTQPAQKASALSPKFVLAWTPGEWALKASLGEAYRFPTVSELYQTVTTGPVLSLPNPDLRPERAVSAELSAERGWHGGHARISLFNERIAHALLSQSAPLVPGSSALFTYVQNVDRTKATGVELAAAQDDFMVKGVGVSGWVTLVDARIAKDTAFAAAEGKHIPQLPKLRGTVVVTWQTTPKLDVALAARYSDRAFGTIDNSDVRANIYQGFSAWFVADAHVRYRFSRHVIADVGVDNLNGRRYFLFHPFPQRTVIASLKYTL